MQTAPTRQLVDVVDTVRGVRTYSSGAVRLLTSCRSEPWGLRLEYRIPEDPDVESESCWLLPVQGLRLTARHPRRGAQRDGVRRLTLITAVRIERDKRLWRTTDLLLGLTVVSGYVPRFAAVQDFAAAVCGGVLSQADADLALRAVHRALEMLTRHRHDMAAWLIGMGINHYWPPLAAPRTAPPWPPAPPAPR